VYEQGFLRRDSAVNPLDCTNENCWVGCVRNAVFDAKWKGGGGIEIPILDTESLLDNVCVNVEMDLDRSVPVDRRLSGRDDAAVRAGKKC